MRGGHSKTGKFCLFLLTCFFLQVTTSLQVPITGTAATLEPRSPAGITTRFRKPVFINTRFFSSPPLWLALCFLGLHWPGAATASHPWCFIAPGMKDSWRGGSLASYTERCRKWEGCR